MDTNKNPLIISLHALTQAGHLHVLNKAFKAELQEAARSLLLTTHSKSKNQLVSNIDEHLTSTSPAPIQPTNTTPLSAQPPPPSGQPTSQPLVDPTSPTKSSPQQPIAVQNAKQCYTQNLSTLRNHIVKLEEKLKEAEERILQLNDNTYDCQDVLYYLTVTKQTDRVWIALFGESEASFNQLYQEVAEEIQKSFADPQKKGKARALDNKNLFAAGMFWIKSNCNIEVVQIQDSSLCCMDSIYSNGKY